MTYELQSPLLPSRAFAHACGRRAFLATLAWPALAGVTNVAWARSHYPNKPIRLIVPYTAGGGVDIVSRALADGLGKHFGWVIVVENRTGAGSNVGSTVVAQAEPDGYTLLTGSNANAVNSSLYTNMPYDPMRDLTPVVLIGNVPMVLLASNAVPIKSVKELIDYAKEHPGKLNFGSGGSGTSEHLTYELFKSRTGTDLVHVPYRGGAAVYPDLISGQVQFFFNNQLQAMPFVKEKTVRALAIANPTRSAQLPNVPTMAEAGIPDFVAAAWWGIMGPGHLPSNIANTINQAVNHVLKTTDFKERLNALGAEALGGTQQRFVDYFTSETERWAKIIKAENVTIN